ncbi:RNA polymerase I termination factor isoform X3 [Hordeum vulgare subsp. vulgare]|uniref:RNA polymerase I termination factor isoform X3 n=1 Tax=Hordeum vulgare subsp. vulgare TaxID=112509 RepID=UPI001D1A47BA|nr:RNA polymerase I termination factor isoform X3 [Hordeum vulgare subsp. vulgare]
MDVERVELEGRRLKKKGKHRDKEGKAKDKSKRRTDEEAVVGVEEEKEGHKRKKGKGRSEENVPVVSGSIENSVGEEQANKSGSMALKPCSEGATNKDSVKKDKKRKKEEKRKEKEAEMTEQKQSFDTTDGKEQAETSGLMAVTPCLEHAQGDMSKDKVKKDKKKKKEEKEAEMTGQQKQTFDTTVENSGAEYAEGDKVKGKQSSKSKKSKHKHDDGAPAAEVSAADQLVTREYKKRKKEHSDVLEESSQTENPNEGENRKIKKGGKERSKASPDFSENASAGGEETGVDGNDDKKKKKSKGIGGGKKEKEKAVRSTKGKRVSFADSAEMFRTKGGDGEGIGGGKKKEKAAVSKKKGKRVSFADSAEVFSIEGGDNEEDGISDESRCVHGRFTPEEDATLMEAMKGYTEMKELGEKGLEMIGSCRKYPELKGCWDDIAESLPHRPREAIYHRARILLFRGAERKWTDDEKEQIRRFVENNGTDWKTLARELGKSEIHVKDTWRRIKPKNLKKGHWTQDEHQNLFDLVNLDLRLKAHQTKNPDHRMLRDNISWEAISDKLTTRNHKNCCLKWYDTLASPMVKEGIWADVDDYLLVEALQKVDAVCIEDVDWDSLLDHRSAEVCRQRWNQMVRGLGGHREKPFIEQVEVLSRRYCPEMIEYRK